MDTPLSDVLYKVSFPLPRSISNTLTSAGDSVVRGARGMGNMAMGASGMALNPMMRGMGALGGAISGAVGKGTIGEGVARGVAQSDQMYNRSKQQFSEGARALSPFSAKQINPRNEMSARPSAPTPDHQTAPPSYRSEMAPPTFQGMQSQRSNPPAPPTQANPYRAQAQTNFGRPSSQPEQVDVAPTSGQQPMEVQPPRYSAPPQRVPYGYSQQAQR